MKKPSLLIIFLTVFIDLVGFGIVLPLLPIYSKNFGASGFMIGLIMASYSLMQFLFAPSWGRLSDRIGRRPVLLVSTAGAALIRLFRAGFGINWTNRAAGAAGISIGRGYLWGEHHRGPGVYRRCNAAGSTVEKDGVDRDGVRVGVHLRAGAGSVQSPFFWPDRARVGPPPLCAPRISFSRLPFFPRAGSRPLSNRLGVPHFAQWLHTLQRPKVGFLIILFFLATFCFTCFETTLGLLMGQNFHLDPKKGEDAKTIGYLFAYCGIVGALVQGGAIGRLVKKMGEPALITFSLILTTAGMAPLPFMVHWTGALLVLGLLSIGSSLARPPIFGMISVLTPADEQGATLGVAQGVGSLARIVGPTFAGTLFDVKPALPYLICSGISLVAGLLAWQYLCRTNQPLVEGTVQNAS